MILLGLGANIGDRIVNLSAAVSYLNQNDVSIRAKSSLYETPPWGNTEQPPFLNAVIAVETYLDPIALLAVIKAAEQSVGRIQRERWGPREVDIDILTYHNTILNQDGLTIPHPALHLRAFVLVPAAEVASDFLLPHFGCSIFTLLRALPANEVAEIRRLDAEW